MQPAGNEELEYQISQYLDGQFSWRRRAALERLIERDPAVAETLRAYAAVNARLAELAGAEVEGVDYRLQRGEIAAALERRVLLDGARHRPILLRPAFGALAAAAVLLAALSAGIVLFAPRPAGPVPGPIVRAEVLHVDAPAREAGTVRVQMRPMGPEALPLAPENPRRQGRPAGTVVVSVTPEEPADGVSLETVLVY